MALPMWAPNPPHRHPEGMRQPSTPNLPKPQLYERRASQMVCARTSNMKNTKSTLSWKCKLKSLRSVWHNIPFNKEVLSHKQFDQISVGGSHTLLCTNKLCLRRTYVSVIASFCIVLCGFEGIAPLRKARRLCRRSYCGQQLPELSALAFPERCCTATLDRVCT